MQGKYNFGIFAKSGKAYEYVAYQLDNVELSYLTSAKAPYAITDFSAIADKKGTP